MSTSLERLTQLYSDAFKHDDFAKFSPVLMLPMVVFVKDSLMVIETENQYIKIMRAFRKNLVTLGYHHSTYKVISENVTKINHLTAQVEGQHFDHDNNVINKMDLKIFCSIDPNDNIRVQIIEFEVPPPDALIREMTLINKT